jgi:hypothetical protein
MRNPAGSISQLHVGRDPRTGAPGAQVVSLVPPEGEALLNARRSSIARVDHTAQGRGSSRDRVVDIGDWSTQAAGDPSRSDQDGSQLAGEVLTLRVGKRCAWRLAAMGAVVIVAVCALGTKAPAILTLVVAIYLGLVWMDGVGHRVRIGIGGVTALSIFGKSRRLHWSDVRAVSFPRGEIVLHGEGAFRVRVPATFDGHRAAVRLLRIRLPRKALNQSRIGLETHYLCQWDDCEW